MKVPALILLGIVVLLVLFAVVATVLILAYNARVRRQAAASSEEVTKIEK